MVTSSAPDVPPAAESAPTPRRTTRRALRWLVPAGAVGVVALLASGALSANANPNLPVQSAAQLLAAVGNSKVAGYSGTVVEKASLGLPQLPDTAGAATGPLGLLSGSHTVRVWYAGENQQRVALLDSLGEQDLFRNGRSVWQWNSDNRTATHVTLPSAAVAQTPRLSDSLTPDQAAQRALAMIGPSTNVSTDRSAVVAGRAAYVLVLTPKDTRSLVGSVRISVDGKTKVPLGVQVYGRGSNKAALDVSFTRFTDTVPSADNFNWTPPSGVAVTQGGTAPAASQALPRHAGATGMTKIGTGWTTIVKLTGVPSVSTLGKDGGAASVVIGSLPEVKGTWGTGRLFTSGLVTALITTDGRVYAGAVEPALLYQAAAAK